VAPFGAPVRGDRRRWRWDIGDATDYQSDGNGSIPRVRDSLIAEGESHLLNAYFKSLYERTMHEAYRTATEEIVASVRDGGAVLDCGANSGEMFDVLARDAPLTPTTYFGVEWDRETAEEGRKRGLQVTCAELNNGIPHQDDMFSCVFGLSVLEHLLHGCRFLRECHRVLQKGGKLVLLTPNISTYFTAALILMGKMPSSGPHPDSDALRKREEL
jgi:2-polyprenyl-3-methyl-5-hydroxy-6-metoxy-1,4-benzoquinol methylase